MIKENRFITQPKWLEGKWVAAKFDNATVLFTIENRDRLPWLEEIHAEGRTREEAVQNLNEKLRHEPNGKMPAVLGG